MEIPCARLTIIVSSVLPTSTMPVFTTSREFRHEQTIQAPQEEILALLHNPQELCSLGPLYKSIVKDEKEEHTYVITDRLPIVGPIEGSTTFRAKLVPTSDGVQTDVSAALGTRLKTKYWAEGREDGSCIVKEITVVKVCMGFLESAKSLCFC